MSDEEDYNSEEDADYVPSDGELGSEEENSGEEEDLSVLADDAGTATATGSKKTRRKKQNKSDIAPRKRKGGIKLEGEANNAAGETNGDTENTELAKKLKEEEAAKQAEKEKKRADDLWSSFLSDVKPAARPPPKASPAPAAVKPASSTADAVTSKSATNTTSASSTPQPASGKITITKVFDFAGEEIKVTKEVDADSKEAKQELKKQEENKEQEEKTSSVASSSSLSSLTKPSLTTAASPGGSILGVKRPAPVGGGLGSVLNKIGKKQKMGTLEKSKMDWDSFKKKEGIEEDLKIHNKGKDGYIERMAFLNRADVRQFEIERDLRLSKSGKR